MSDIAFVCIVFRVFGDGGGVQPVCNPCARYPGSVRARAILVPFVGR